LELRRNADDRLFDAIARNKARIGRRVWEGRNVYMEDKGERVNVDQEVWKESVNFKESKRTVVPRPKSKKYLGKHFDPAIAAARSPRF